MSLVRILKSDKAFLIADSLIDSLLIVKDMSLVKVWNLDKADILKRKFLSPTLKSRNFLVFVNEKNRNHRECSEGA